MENTEPKNPVVIEAPSRDQISAAKRYKRNIALPQKAVATPETRRQARGYVEGIALMILAIVLFFALSAFEEIAWIIALMTFLAGIMVMVRGHFR